MTERNALAELAKELSDFQEYLHRESKVGDRGLEKAHRIVSILASYYEPCFPVKSGDDVIDECRAVAEGGGGEGERQG